MSPKPQAIAETVGYQIVQICKAHRNKAQELLAPLNLHPGQEMVLVHLLEKDGVSQRELGEDICVQPATVTRMVDRLEEAGLVRRSADSADQRVMRVDLTAQGQALREPLAQVWRDLERLTLAGFTAEERILLRRLLLQVYQNLV